MSARPEDVQATFAATLVDEWVRAGMAHAVVCPGSRSTPLALAVAGRSELRIHVHQDERSGGYLALGLGVATGVPAVVVTTSGTAAAELHPAVVEAHQAGVPLLACTTDRPPELQDVGGPQVIDQTHLFGRAVRWFADPGVPDARMAGRWRALAARAYVEATGDPPGPVQLNLPFREPLVGTPGPLPSTRPGGPWIKRVELAGRPSIGVTPSSTATGIQQGARLDPGGARRADDGRSDVERLPARWAGRRGVIVAGEGSGDGAMVHRLAELLGWPVLAEPRAPAWRPAATLVAHADALLRAPRAADRLRPDVVVRLGPPPASRVVNEWLAGAGAEEVVVAGPSWSDPAGTAAVVVQVRPAEVVPRWLAVFEADAPPAPHGWLAAWQGAATVAAETLGLLLDRSPEQTEPGVARELVAALPDGAWLVVSSSMPVRDVERYAAPRSGLRVCANRGANGIDGVVSTAVGVAAATGAPTGLLIGDLAFLHDSNGLLGAATRGVDLVCVVVDNDGGGIFSFLPQARSLAPERFERLFGTPHGLDLVALAHAYGAAAGAVDADLAGHVRAALEAGGLHVLVVRTDRAVNVDVHRRLDEAVSAAVDTALAD